MYRKLEDMTFLNACFWGNVSYFFTSFSRSASFLDSCCESGYSSFLDESCSLLLCGWARGELVDWTPTSTAEVTYILDDRGKWKIKKLLLPSSVSVKQRYLLSKRLLSLSWIRRRWARCYLRSIHQHNGIYFSCLCMWLWYKMQVSHITIKLDRLDILFLVWLLLSTRELEIISKISKPPILSVKKSP
jgi:hypothetical protein